MFKKLYDSLGGKLPPATQLLITLSNIFVHGFIFIVVALIGMVIAYRKWVATPRGKAVRSADPLAEFFSGPPAVL